MRRTTALLAACLFITAFPFLPVAARRLNPARAAQTSQKRQAQAAAAAAIVREIDLEALKALLRPDLKQPRPLLVTFWATWCDPCREEFPDLVEIDRDYKARGLQFITVSLDDPTEIKTGVQPYLEKMRSTMPAYLLNVPDPEPAIKLVDAAWGGGLPATFLFDEQGRVVFKHMGRIKPAELRQAIEAVVSDKRGVKS